MTGSVRTVLHSTLAKVGLVCVLGGSAGALLVANGTFAQRPPPRASRPLQERLSQDLAFLAADALEGRLVGTAGELAAVGLVKQRFESVGLQPVAGRGWVHPFSYTLEDGSPVEAVGNVVGVLDVGAARTLVVGAHHDHLGMGGRHSREPFRRGIHNGADDNASGVALLLALAEHFSTRDPPLPVNLVFASFSGEEDGLHGSQALLAEGWLRPGDVVAAINFDMVGRMDTAAPTVGVEGVVETPWLGSVLERVPHPAFQLRTVDPILPGGSDHCSFADKGIPVLGFSTGQSSDYHRSSDDVDRVNVDGMVQLHAFVVGVMEALAAVDGAPGQVAP